MSVAIRTERLELCSLDPEGAEAVLAGSPPLGVSWAQGYPLDGTREAARIVLDREPAPRWVNPFVAFEIVRRSDDHVIGDCGFRSPPDSDGIVEVHYELVDSAAGRGYEAEALEALVGFAFTRDEVSCVRAWADSGDIPTRRVLEEAGMMQVGEQDERILFEA